MQLDRNGLEILERDECLRLMSTATLGRVGVTSGALPAVLPVNFRLVEDHVVFRTSTGSKLDAATCNAVVAFETDHIDAMSHEGWSVMITGIAREVTDPHHVERLDRLGVPHWAPAGGERLVALSAELVTGRRIAPRLLGNGRTPTR